MTTREHAFDFDKQQRLSKELDFKRVLKLGSSLRKPSLQIFFLVKDSFPSRLGIWVRKRDFKKAADRNKLKRWVREFFRKRKKDFPAAFDVIVRIKPGKESRDHRQMDSLIEGAFREAGLMR